MMNKRLHIRFDSGLFNQQPIAFLWLLCTALAFSSCNSCRNLSIDGRQRAGNPAISNHQPKTQIWPQEESGLPIISQPLNTVGKPAETYIINGNRFQRQNVSGMGMRCFFNSMGLVAEEQMKILMEYKNDPIPRAMVANEIVSGLAVPDELPKPVRDAIGYDLFKSAYDSFNKAQEEFGKKTSQLGSEERALMRLEINRTEKHLHKVTEEMRVRASSMNVFETFVKHHIGNNQMMVTLRNVQEESDKGPFISEEGYTSIDAIAYANKFGLAIYSKDPKHSNKLQLTHQYIPEGASKVVYIYREGLHYQALIPEGA